MNDDFHAPLPAEAEAERTSRLLAHLDGALDAAMLDAMHETWAMLERVAADSTAHGRAVRSRLMWESFEPTQHRDAA
jgi:hypothetical protein